MEEGDVDTWSGNVKTFDEIRCVGRLTVRSPPKRDVLGEVDSPKSRLLEDVDVLAPGFGGVDAVGPVPIVIPGCNVDTHRIEVGERAPQKGRSVRRHATMLEEVSSAEERVDVRFLDDSDNVGQGVPQSLAPAPSRVSRGPTPRESGIQMKVGEVDDLQVPSSCAGCVEGTLRR